MRTALKEAEVMARGDVGPTKSPLGSQETAGFKRVPLPPLPPRSSAVIPFGPTDSPSYLHIRSDTETTGMYDKMLYNNRLQSSRIVLVELRRFLACAVERRAFLAGANPARQLSLQPVVARAVHGGNDMS